MLAVSELLNYDFLAHAQLPPEGTISDRLFENIFLYGAGLKFIQAVRAAGGWEAVDDVFADPPQATTLILNPERYLAGERTVEPLEIPLKAGETLISKTIQGEYAVQLLLARQAQTRSLLENIEKSYITDTLGVIANSRGNTVHRWIIELSHVNTTETLAEGLMTALLEADLETSALAIVQDNTVIAEW